MTHEPTALLSPFRPAPTQREGLNAWVKLALGVALVLAFIFILGPLSKHIPGAKRMGEVIDERNLRAAAIYYTDLEESAEGSSFIRNSLEYPPRAPDGIAFRKGSARPPG